MGYTAISVVTSKTFSQTLTFLEDAEEFVQAASEGDIFNCFRLILGRYPSLAEWRAHCSHVGRPLVNVAAVYVDSAEYRNLREGRTDRKAELAQLPEYVMYASPDDYDIGIHILNQVEYEPHVSRVFAKRLAKGMTVLDIGANIGYFTFLAAARVGPSGRVWAIEPNRKNVACLLATRARNQFNHVEIFQGAASDRWEVLTLALGCATSNGTAIEARGAEPADFGESVMAFPLSACLPRTGRIDVIKIDVEGGEGRALRGMLDILDRDAPVVFSEFTPSTLPTRSGISPSEYLEMFTGRGYALAVLEDSAPRFMTAAAVLEHAGAVAAHSHLDILAEPAQRLRS